jgi:hypothetical protein
MTRLLLLSDISGLHVVGRLPWRKDGSVIYSYNLLSLSGPNHAEVMTTSYCLIRDSLNPEGQARVFISPRITVAKLYPRALCNLLVASYDSQGYDEGILTRFHGEVEVEVNLTTYGQSASLSWCRNPIWRPWPDFFLPDDCGFLEVGHPLWRGDGFVIYLYNCFWALPEPSLFGRHILLSHLRLPHLGGPGPTPCSTVACLLPSNRCV